MAKELLIAIVIIACGVAFFLFMLHQTKHPWFSSTPITIAIFFAYNVIQPSLGLPKISGWVLVGIIVFHVIADFIWFCKDQAKKEREEQAKRKEEERSIE